MYRTNPDKLSDRELGIDTTAAGNHSGARHIMGLLLLSQQDWQQVFDMYPIQSNQSLF